MIHSVTKNSSPLVVVHGPVIRHLRLRTTRHTVITLASAVGLTFGHLAKIERCEKFSVRPEVFAALARELAVEDHRVLLANPRGTTAAPAAATAA